MNKRLFRVVLIVGFAAVIAAALFRFGPLKSFFSARALTSSTLTKAIDISDLSTAEFKYRGIAEVYHNEKRTSVRCRICYSAAVKAGIDMKKVAFEIDQDAKTVTAALPEIEIKVNLIDENSMSVLPSDADVSIPEMLKYGKEDAEREAMESGELKKAARENLESVIRGLLLPILRPKGYTLVFK